MWLPRGALRWGWGRVCHSWKGSFALPARRTRGTDTTVRDGPPRRPRWALRSAPEHSRAGHVCFAKSRGFLCGGCRCPGPGPRLPHPRFAGELGTRLVGEEQPASPSPALGATVPTHSCPNGAGARATMAWKWSLAAGLLTGPSADSPRPKVPTADQQAHLAPWPAWPAGRGVVLQTRG